MANESVADTPAPRQRPIIGSRWRPGPVERWDSERGIYEAVNPHTFTQTAIKTQRALLAKVSDPAMEARIEQAKTARRVGAES